MPPLPRAEATPPLPAAGQAQEHAQAQVPAQAQVEAQGSAHVPQVNKLKTVRSPFQINAGNAPKGLPDGTESSVDSLHSAMQQYAVGQAAVPISDGGGGFSIYRYGQVAATAAKASGTWRVCLRCLRAEWAKFWP